MEEYKELYFESLSDFIGYGNPNGTYWFIGIEEHFKPSNNPADIRRELKRLDIYEREYDNVKKPYWLSKNDFESFYSEHKNLENESDNDSTTKCILEILAFYGVQCNIGELWQENSEMFIANLFPLGKGSANAEYDSYFTEKYIFSGRSFENWKKYFWEQRKNHLIAFINQFLKDGKNHKLFCFGVTYKSYFDSILNQLLGEYLKAHQVIHNNNIDVCLIYHPSRLNRWRFENNYLRKVLKGD